MLLLVTFRSARNCSNGMASPAAISASHSSSKETPGPPSEKSASICLSQATESCVLSQLTSVVFSFSGSSVMAAFIASKVMSLAYAKDWLRGNTVAVPGMAPRSQEWLAPLGRKIKEKHAFLSRHRPASRSHRRVGRAKPARILLPR